MGAATTILVEVNKVVRDVIEVSAVTLDEAMQLASNEAGVINVVTAYYPDNKNHELIFSECENCFEEAWDGRICHACGCKEI